MTAPRRRRGAAILLAGLVVGLAMPAPADDRVLVFSAGSLTSAVGEMIDLCAAAGAGPIAASYAASGVLARQIAEGATADLFVSANTDWMDYLDGRGLVVEGSRRRFAGNALVLIAPAGAEGVSHRAGGAASPAAALDGLAADARIAMGDPAYVPGGAYAKAALQHLGSWAALEGRVAGAPTVRAALALVETGAAPLGIVFATDARISRRVRVVAGFRADSHPPIVYEIALLRDRDTAAARAVFDCLRGDAASAILAAHGFTPADRSAPGGVER